MENCICYFYHYLDKIMIDSFHLCFYLDKILFIWSEPRFLIIKYAYQKQVFVRYNST